MRARDLDVGVLAAVLALGASLAGCSLEPVSLEQRPCRSYVDCLSAQGYYCQALDTGIPDGGFAGMCVPIDGSILTMDAGRDAGVDTGIDAAEIDAALDTGTADVGLDAATDDAGDDAATDDAGDDAAAEDAGDLDAGTDDAGDLDAGTDADVDTGT